MLLWREGAGVNMMCSHIAQPCPASAPPFDQGIDIRSALLAASKASRDKYLCLTPLNASSCMSSEDDTSNTAIMTLVQSGKKN